MKVWKSLIRIWLTLVSVASFLIGWVVIAHAPKPNQFKASSVPAMPKLDPVPSLDQVIKTMYQTGMDMQSRYKETSLAGLALNRIEC